MMLTTAYGPHNRMRRQLAHSSEGGHSIRPARMPIRINNNPSHPPEWNARGREWPAQPPPLDHLQISGRSVSPVEDMWLLPPLSPGPL
jgi:hypothetical protein